MNIYGSGCWVVLMWKPEKRGKKAKTRKLSILTLLLDSFVRFQLYSIVIWLCACVWSEWAFFSFPKESTCSYKMESNICINFPWATLRTLMAVYWMCVCTLNVNIHSNWIIFYVYIRSHANAIHAAHTRTTHIKCHRYWIHATDHPNRTAYSRRLYVRCTPYVI